MSDLKIDLKDCEDKVIVKTLRNALRSYDDNPLTTWRWWSGFLIGAVFIAALDYGDVHICVGGCSENYAGWGEVQP